MRITLAYTPTDSEYRHVLMKQHEQYFRQYSSQHGVRTRQKFVNSVTMILECLILIRITFLSEQ